ncbi:YIP1 family protein [Capnocytophaga catalasegens]|nr:YIP1 family protein [Capnocytophaga catalasegens]
MKNFFYQLEKISSMYGISIVLVMAILFSYLGYMAFDVTQQVMAVEKSMTDNETFAKVMNVTKYITLGSSFITSIIGWLFYAGVFFLLALIFNRNSSFKRILLLSSYGYIFSIISATLTIYFLGEVDFTDYQTAFEVQKLIGEYQYIGHLFNIFFVAYMVGVIWYVCEIKIWQAIVVAAVPVLIFTLFSIVIQNVSTELQQM